MTTHASLFSGCGGFSCGARAAGLADVLAVERDPRCVASYRLNHPGVPALHAPAEDVSDAQARGFGPVDVCTAGVPCEPYSTANRHPGRAADPRRGLYRHAARLAAALGARAVLVENVPGYANQPEAAALRAALAAAGFDRQDARVLNAAGHCVPQARRRWFLYAARTPARAIRWPAPGGPAPTVLEAFAGLPHDPGGGYAAGGSRYADRLRDRGFWRSPAGPPGLTHHAAPGLREATRARYALVPAGRRVKHLPGLWGDRPAALLRATGVLPARDYGQRGYRLRWDRPAVTVTAHASDELIHPAGRRGVTAREAARLMSFPDAYRWDGPLTGPGNAATQSVFAMIGDAVPPLLAYALAAAVVEALS